MRKKIILFAAMCMCALVALQGCRQEPRLIILHTNDTHSHLDPIRGGKADGKGGVIERAAFIDSVRAAEGAERVLLLDAGDFSQGTSYFTELEGAIEPILLNNFGYDVVELGNHEFDNNIEALTERLKLLDGPKVVCANIDFSSFELGQYVQPYAIVERGGMKIGIIGLDAKLEGNVVRTVTDRIQQLDDVEVVCKWTKVLHEDERCDLVILLSHLGYDGDQALVPLITGVDLVIGGHSHTFVDDMIYVCDAAGKKVPIVTDGCWGEQVGKITVL